MPKLTSSILIWSAALFLALVLLSLSVLSATASREIGAGLIKVNAEVVDVEGGKGKSSGKYAAVYFYKVDEQKYRNTGPDFESQKPKVGSRRTIVVTQSSPLDIQFESLDTDKTQALLFAVAGLILLVPSVIILVRTARER